MTKHHEDKAKVQRRQKGVNKITDVISNQMVNPFKCEDQELINISTGHKATSAREKGLEALAAARRTNSEKVSLALQQSQRNQCLWHSKPKRYTRRVQLCRTCTLFRT